MKERPILFNGAMVRALLAGTKTQTRREFKAKNGGVWPRKNDLPGMQQILRNCPYGQPGDRLWVRETWQGPLLEEFESDADPEWMTPSRIHQYQTAAHCEYAADGGPAPEFIDSDDNIQRRWRPAIHMFRWASRILLEITDVRVERLQDISRADAQAEGCEHDDPCDHVRQSCASIGCIGPDYRIGYLNLWERINGAGSWAANPWVWVVEFKAVKP